MTGLECSTDAERCWCGATCPLRRFNSRRGYRLLLFAPSSNPHCKVCTMTARQAAGELGVHSAPLQSACCTSRHAMTSSHWGDRFFQHHRRREAPVPRIGLSIVGISITSKGRPWAAVWVPTRHLAGGEWPPGRTGGLESNRRKTAPRQTCGKLVRTPRACQCNSGWAAGLFRLAK